MKLFGRKRFAELAIGAGIEKTLAILCHGVRGEGDDRVECLSASDDVCDVVARLPQKHGCEQSVYRVVLGVQLVAV